MMSSVPSIAKRLFLCLGLGLTLAGATAATVGYLAARDEKSRPVLILKETRAPTTKKSTVSAANSSSSIAAAKKGSKVTTSARTTKQTAACKTASAAAPATKPAIPTQTVTAVPTVSPAVAQWRRMMLWGGGVFVVGLASVAYSIHEMRPKPPSTGADELLNDAPPF